MTKRIEKDLIGEMEVDDSHYYGVHSQRAIENFPITGIKTSNYPVFIAAFAKIKKTSALANKELGELDAKLAEYIIKACDKLIAGEYHEHFAIDMIQGGAGTSMNMNANEVIANVALELMGNKKGEYTIVSPNDHVNMSQSTNDTYPSSIKVAVYEYIDTLVAEMNLLIKSLEKKGEQYKHVVKVGRTQLQDAVPMTVGQWFNNYANQVRSSIETLLDSRKVLLGLNMGATAIGTGITANPAYSKTFDKHVKDVIGKDFFVMKDLFVGTQDASGFTYVSGGLKRFAVQLSKICNDFRLASSGPRAGLGEITLPAKQAGSSIMPGKINPVIAEAVNQVCFQVIGNDTAISFAAEGGQLELNAFEPLMVLNLLESINMLKNGLKTLRINLVDGLVVNEKVCQHHAENNISIVTALNSYIGYKKSTMVAQKCLEENKSVYQVVLELGLMEESKLKEVLNLNEMVYPRR
ncbi:MAG: aspartate ammonia-lyase [Alphaproteobacteria bacterium]|jgi:aspartate ammonia-lyase|nr:aspartate ammonia-lyase [Alphaproteobacteria bacterium]